MRTVLRWIVVALVMVHGLLHLLGAVKGFGWAPVTGLDEPIGAGTGVAWLLVALLVLAAGLLLAVRAPVWWAVTAVAAVVSQAVLATSWSDARAGTAVNVLMLVAAGYGYLSERPSSLRAEYRRRVTAALGEPVLDGVVTDADLAGLPQPLADYLRRCGAVGQPRVHTFSATVYGRIRGRPDKRWMTFTGRQVNRYGRARGGCS